MLSHGQQLQRVARMYYDRQRIQPDHVLGAGLLQLRQGGDVGNITATHCLDIGFTCRTARHPDISLAAQQRFQARGATLRAHLHPQFPHALRPLGDHVVLVRVQSRINADTGQAELLRPGGGKFDHERTADGAGTRQTQGNVVRQSACRRRRRGWTGLGRDGHRGHGDAKRYAKTREKFGDTVHG